jgi:hypothetical protein
MYSYIWKTNKAWKNSCRELQLTLSDGKTHLAQFYFRK